jgi:hypothetical protein
MFVLFTASYMFRLESGHIQVEGISLNIAYVISTVTFVKNLE